MRDLYQVIPLKPQCAKSKLKQKKTNQNKRDTLKNKNQKNKGKIIKLSKYRKD